MLRQVGGDWSAGELGTKTLFWNPGAVTYLAELLFASVLAAYLLWRLVRERRQGRVFLPTLLLTVMVSALVPTLLSSLLRVLTAGGWVSYAMPWSPLAAWSTLAMPWAPAIGGVVIGALVLFAYNFPRPLTGAGRETAVIGVLLAGLVAIETAIAVRADAAMLAQRAWWRPDWLAGWMILGVAWAAVVFWRQLADLQRPPDARSAGWGARLGADLRAVLRPARNREAAAARGFLLFTVLPLLHTAALLVVPAAKLEKLPIDVIICWSALAQLLGFTLILVGALPERSSFLFKVTAICLALLLGAASGAAWISAPIYTDLFRAPGLVASGDALSLIPRGDLAYAVGPSDIAEQTGGGELVGPDGLRVSLPFKVRFYGRSYDTAFVSSRGSIGFATMPEPVDAAFHGGAQPAIFPLLVGEDASRTQVRARVLADRLIVTRRDLCPPAARDLCYALQTTLHPDGRVDVLYLDAPLKPTFRLFDPVRAPWLIGVVPGPGRPSAQPLVSDYHRAFLTYLDRLYAPFAQFTIAAALAILIALPLLLRSFLTQPLARLLHGIQRFRSGDLGVQVAGAYNDEIGYLTESFNEMAREQRRSVVEMEARIADRVAEIADMTVRTAQLEERARLCAELHDSVAQSLASASLLAQAVSLRLRNGEFADTDADNAERVSSLNRHALQEMRLLLAELRGADAASDATVAEQLAALATSFRELHALEVDSEVVDKEPPPAEVRAMVVRVAQEALNNVVKHSGAGRARVVYEGGGRGAFLAVVDQGRGFDPAQTYEAGRLGLAIMRDRARSLGASLEIESRSGDGCEVRLNWVRA